MERLTITLPAEQRAFVKAQITSGQYATESEVVRDLIRQRQREQAREWLTQELLKGLEGDEVELTPDEMSRIWEKARAEAARRRGDARCA
ncbi:MAG: type II toxin-antitoxin system ParD family antitoxin [Phycisphaerales bacterium JB063]